MQKIKLKVYKFAEINYNVEVSTIAYHHAA